MKLMRDRVMDSVTARTGIDPRDYDSIIHATTHPGRDADGGMIDHGGQNNLVRNVYA